MMDLDNLRNLKINGQHLVIGGLVAAIAFSQMSKPRGASPEQLALQGLAMKGIESARGTYVCVSFNCAGSGGQEQLAAAQAPRQQTIQVQYVPIQPGMVAVDQSGRPLPTEVRDGQTYALVEARF